jgi:hypothetical protein
VKDLIDHVASATNNVVPAAAVAFSFYSWAENHRDDISFIVMCVGGLASFAVFLRNIHGIYIDHKRMNK